MGAAKVETCWREDGDQVLNLTLLGQFGVDFGTILGSFRDMGRIMKVMKNLRFFDVFCYSALLARPANASCELF